jgi:hypothetical protein
MRKFFVIFVCLLVVGCEVEDDDNDINYDSNWETLPAPVAPDTMIKHDDVFFVNEQKGWLVTRNGQIYNTIDGGESWTESSFGWHVNRIDFYPVNWDMRPAKRSISILLIR